MNDAAKIEKMLDAGFTAEEIRTFFGGLVDKGGEDNTPSDVGDEQGGAPAPSPDTPPEPTVESEALKMITELRETVTKQIDELQKSYQEYNLKLFQNKEVPKELTGVEACAQVLNPWDMSKREEN